MSRGANVTRAGCYLFSTTKRVVLYFQHDRAVTPRASHFTRYGKPSAANPRPDQSQPRSEPRVPMFNVPVCFTLYFWDPASVYNR